MSENTTENMADNRNFEERVFARFDALDARFDGMDSRFDALDLRLNAVESRLDAVEVRLDAVEARLEALESRIDAMDSRLQKLEEESERRSRETKPIWERAVAQIAELQQAFTDFREEVREGFRDISRKFGVVGNDLLQLRANQTHIETRLGKLESEFQS